MASVDAPHRNYTCGIKKGLRVVQHSENTQGSGKYLENRPRLDEINISISSTTRYARIDTHVACPSGSTDSTVGFTKMDGPRVNSLLELV